MIALVGIMIENEESVEKVNALLHDYRNEVLGRMGLPLKDKQMNVINIVLDTDSGKINALTGKLGSVAGVRAKALYGNK